MKTALLFGFLIFASCVASAQSPSQPAAQPTAAVPAPAYYYYCNDSQEYYPNVKQCPGGWVSVPANPPPSARPVFVPVRVWRLPPPPNSQDAVIARPNALTLELGGRAWAYSVDYDRSVSEHITLGLGVSSWRASRWWWNEKANVTVVPIYSNFYFSQNPFRGYLSVGADFDSISATGVSTELVGPFTSNGVSGTIGGGFEGRSDGGFIYRISGFIIAGKVTSVQPALSIGYAF